jgi:hypothetical protein
MEKERQKSDSPGTCKEMLNAICRYSEHIREYGGTLWESYVLTCLSSGDVQKCFANHVDRKEQYLGARCWAGPGLPGEALVLFLFQRPAPAYELLPEAFLARLNLSSQAVEVCEPYSGHLLRCGRDDTAILFPASAPPPCVPDSTTKRRGEQDSSSY